MIDYTTFTSQDKEFFVTRVLCVSSNVKCPLKRRRCGKAERSGVKGPMEAEGWETE